MPRKPRHFSALSRAVAFGKIFRKARERLKQTQQDIAERIGHSGPDAGAYVSKVEAGQIMPELLTLEKLCGVLRVPMEKLLKGGKGV